MVQHSPFIGKEDPNLHLQAFIQLCQTFNMNGVTQDQMRARLFPFSLLGKSLQWFHSQPEETVQNWNALMRAFMKEYYSPGKTQSLCNKIATFAQYPMETISKAFERFNVLTPKIGTGKGLTCGPSLVAKYHSARKIFSEDKGCLRSAMHHHSAKGLFALLKGSFRECVVTWPDIRKE
jgi:hypothetical protein